MIRVRTTTTSLPIIFKISTENYDDQIIQINDFDVLYANVGPTYDVDQLNHCHSKLDSDGVREVLDRTNEWIVALGSEQMINKSHLILAAQTFIGKQILNIT